MTSPPPDTCCVLMKDINSSGAPLDTRYTLMNDIDSSGAPLDTCYALMQDIDISGEQSGAGKHSRARIASHEIHLADALILQKPVHGEVRLVRVHILTMIG